MLYLGGINVLNNLLLVCFFGICQSNSLTTNAENSPTVMTKYGEVEGLWQISYTGRKYAAFEGIPYALAPVGQLRFEEPKPIEPWTGTLKATEVDMCIQISILTQQTTGDEDCLYLSVYVPQPDNSSNGLDVVVHLHGGGFFQGYGSEWTNPKYLMDRDIIFVTIHYRLGPLGFLSTEDNVVPGNNGLKDQSLALKWIKENIDAFGGNPNSITLTGFSAGATSVQYHYLSPLSRNLFHKGMSVSGSVLNPFALQKNPAKRAKILAKALSCETTNNSAMIDCMKKIPAHTILQTTNDLFNPHPLIIYCAFTPVIEPESKTAFISQHPYKFLQEGGIYDVPWMATSTSDEGYLLSLMIMGNYDFLDKNWNTILKSALHYEDVIPESTETEIASKIRKFYFPDGQINEDNYKGLTNLWSDRMIVKDAMLAAKMQAEVNKSPVYVYKFGYPSRFALKGLLGKTNYPGAAHGDDMTYFFGGLINAPLTEEENKMQNIALDILCSFAHDGKPMIPNVDWSPLSKDFNYVKIDGPNAISMGIKTDYTSEKFWKNLGLLENENIFPDKNKS